MKTKACMKCGETKPLAAFYSHPMMADGTVNKCKECNKKDVRENREKKIDYYQEYDRSRSMRPDRISARSKYQATPNGRASTVAAKKRWAESNLIKRSAQIQVRNALRSGRLIKVNSCQTCAKNGRTHAHHDDYAFPLSIRWLCPKCHSEWHKENGEGLNG